MKVAVCCIAKMENHYLREYVEWYKNVGFANVILYDNNDVDGERFEDVIGDYITDGFVIVKDFRGRTQCQMEAYQSCYNEYNSEYDWIGFFDADEYFETDKMGVNEFVSQSMFSDANAIRLCWKNYDDGGILRVENNDYSMNRFTTTVDENNICNRTTKVMVRGGQSGLAFYMGPGGTHGQYLPCFTRDCEGNPNDNKQFVLPHAVWTNGWIRHYRFKTIEEFCRQKMQRLYLQEYDVETSKKMLQKKDFFEYNLWTQEKEDLFNELMGIKKKDLKTLICCIGKNENQYVREYVEWYRQLGVTHICLYDNNDLDGEHFDDAIGDYINDGYVEVIDFRGREVCQLQSYTECYHNNKNEYDWILFIDCGDEYLTFHHFNTISDYLSDARFDEYDLIHVNLLTYGDCDQLENDGRLLTERFPYPIDVNTNIAYNFPESFHVSSIVRGGLEDIKWEGQGFTHTPSPNTLRCCNGTGIACDGNSPFNPYDFREAVFRHYTTKTAREYCNKMRRGFPDQKWDGSRVKNLIETRFFRTNIVTKEKVDIFKEELGVDMSYLLPSTYEGEKNKDVKIYSLCYAKKNFQFINDSVVTPLQVGAAVNKDNVCEVKDNEGDNISGANYFYIEGTGTYWIWKNVHDAKYKGQMQYRRPLEGVNETMNFDEMFEKYDVITCEPFHHPDHKTPTEEEPMVIPADTVEQGYAFSNCIDDLLILEYSIKLQFPEYAEDYDKYIKNGPDLYYSNGFIMKAEDYDRYASFLFACLNGYLSIANIHNQDELIKHVKYNLEVRKYPRYGKELKVTDGDVKWQTEIGGFLSERVWTLWLQHNFAQDRICKLPYIKQEEGMYT